MDHRNARHALSANQGYFRLPPLPTAHRNDGGNPAFGEIDRSYLPVRGLQALAEIERHRIEMRLQKSQIRIRHGVQNAVSLHVARSVVDHGTGPLREPGTADGGCAGVVRRPTVEGGFEALLRFLRS